eukprot:jgi/Chrzof1/3693/Cz13g05120.t1
MLNATHVSGQQVSKLTVRIGNSVIRAACHAHVQRWVHSRLGIISIYRDPTNPSDSALNGLLSALSAFESSDLINQHYYSF